MRSREALIPLDCEQWLPVEAVKGPQAPLGLSSLPRACRAPSAPAAAHTHDLSASFSWQPWTAPLG